MSLNALFFRWHRWLGYLVSIQILAWVLGGVLFSWLPIQAWVKSGDAVAKPQQPLPEGWAKALDSAAPGPLLAVQSVATARGPALRLRYADGERWRSAGGGDLAPPDAAAIEHFALSLYRGGGRLAGVDRVEQAPPRLGIVHEAGGRRDLWRARFDDSFQTRLYFDARSGEMLLARNEVWVLYDFFYRLHIMDYGGGEDINNTLLRVVAPVALGLVITGLVLLTLALRRALRRRH